MRRMNTTGQQYRSIATKHKGFKGQGNTTARMIAKESIKMQLKGNP